MKIKTEFTVIEILQKKITESKTLFMNVIVKKFSPCLHWNTSSRIFTYANPYEFLIAFKCKICKEIVRCRFPVLVPLTHHLM